MTAAGTGIMISSLFFDGTEMPMVWVVSVGTFAATASLLVVLWDRRRSAAAAATLA